MTVYPERGVCGSKRRQFYLASSACDQAVEQQHSRRGDNEHAEGPGEEVEVRVSKRVALFHATVAAQLAGEAARAVDARPAASYVGGVHPGRAAEQREAEEDSEDERECFDLVGESLVEEVQGVSGASRTCSWPAAIRFIREDTVFPCALLRRRARLATGARPLRDPEFFNANGDGGAHDVWIPHAESRLIEQARLQGLAAL
jgi:hypothetical protein